MGITLHRQGVRCPGNANARVWKRSTRPRGLCLITPAPTTTQDDSGGIWGLQLLKGQSSQIIAQAGVKPGPPLLVRPEVAVRGRIVDVSVVMQGQAGEKYVPGVQRNDKWLPAPKFRLISESGKVIAQGQFEYG